MPLAARPRLAPARRPAARGRGVPRPVALALAAALAAGPAACTVEKTHDADALQSAQADSARAFAILAGRDSAMQGAVQGTLLDSAAGEVQPGAPAGAASTAVPGGDSVPAEGFAPGAAGDSAAPADRAAARGRLWAIPVDGVQGDALRDTWGESRAGGRPHEALDIPAPRGTPVLAADDGTVLKLFDSREGGRTLYVASPVGGLVHYYAHLDGYRPGLAEGQRVRRGDVLGTVGATGNARPDAPHLHFAIARLSDPRRWWAGAPINPYPLLREDNGR